MSTRKLLFSFDSGNDEGPNIIRVYDDNTYTAQGRGNDIIPWKFEDGIVWWLHSYNNWQKAESGGFIEGFTAGLLEKCVEESIFEE